MPITSADNAKVVESAKLLDKKYRKASGKYLIEGERLIRDALLHGAQICDIFVKESVQEKYAFPNCIVVADKVFSKMCDTVNSQGVLATVLSEKKNFETPKGNCLVLDGVQDPGNFGTLVRTAAACGFTDVFAANCVDAFSPKVLRSAMSAHFCVNIWQEFSIEEIFEKLSPHCRIIAADAGGTNLFTTHLEGKIALVLGNEGNGISDCTRKNAAQIVSLPMQNNFESLNVAVAGSIVMYRIFEETSTKQ